MNQFGADDLALDSLGRLFGEAIDSPRFHLPPTTELEKHFPAIDIWLNRPRMTGPADHAAEAAYAVIAISGESDRPSEPIDRMQHLVELLNRLNFQTGGNVSALLEDLVDQLDTPPSDTARLLPTAAVDALVESGSFVDQLPDPTKRGSTQTVLQRQRLRRDALTMDDVRRILGVSDSRIRQRISKRTLHTLADVGQGRRFPAYQFTEDAELPSWRDVAPAFPDDVDLISVEHLMSSPHADLSVDGEPVSPREWLLAERPADKVIDLVHQAYEIL